MILKIIEKLTEETNLALTQLPWEIEGHPSTAPFQEEIAQAHAYPLAAGGKRIRPLLLSCMAGAIGGQIGIFTSRQAALAVETLHTYSLVHDDLPCMDNDDLRRGKPTTHIVYGEAKALLVGDGLLAHSFYLLSKINWAQKNFLPEVLESLSLAAAPKGIIWGQWLDLSLTGKEDTNWEMMETVHLYKTGVLLGACFEIGLMCGLSPLEANISPQQLTNLRNATRMAGQKIGLSFQIIDDILDSTQSSEHLGKTSGKDEHQKKFTAVKLLGLKKAKALAQQYTEQSLETLHKIFAQLNFNDVSQEKSQYKQCLFSTLTNLLTRSN